MAFEDRHFGTEEVSNTGEERVLRAALKDKADAAEWVSMFAETTRTEWVKLRTYPNPVRYVFRGQWGCAFSSKNKRAHTKRNLACPVKLHVLIKLNTPRTRKSDHFLRGNNPKAAVVTITGTHNHDIERDETSKLMRGKRYLRETFYQYFQRGMTPSQAMKLHVGKIMAEEGGTELLADAHFNPTKRTVHHWYQLWRKNTTQDSETLGSFWENFLSVEISDEPSIAAQPANTADAGGVLDRCSPAGGSDHNHSLPIEEAEGDVEASQPTEDNSKQDIERREKANALFTEIMEKCLSLHGTAKISPAYVTHLETINDKLSSINDSEVFTNAVARIASNTEAPRFKENEKAGEMELRKRKRKPSESDSEEE